MTLISLKTEIENNTDLLGIGLSDGSNLIIKNFYLNYYNGIPDTEINGLFSSLTNGSEISLDLETAFRFASACYKAERAGMRLIARAEQTCAGLARKLEARNHDPACVSAVIVWFIRMDLVNDGRYAERWLRSRLSRRNGKVPGPRRLYAALASRGIDRDALKDAFNKTLDEETEFILLQRYMAKNRGTGIYGAYSRGALRYEGFSSPVINRYIEETRSG